MAFDMTTALTIKANVVGQGQVDRFGKSLGDVENNSNKASTGLRKLAQAGNSLTGVLARVGVAAATANFVRAGIESDRTSKRLHNLTKEYGETAKVQEFAAAMAERYGLSQVQAANGVTDLFGRLRPMNVSLTDIQTVFKGVNTAAARMNLTTAETDGVMLQLSQALGSGKLQGDEFRSIMERLPAIGQAVAATMKTDVAALKELSSEGKITTDVIIQSLQGLANQQVPEIDAYKRFQAALSDLSMTIGTQLLPALTPFIQLANSLLGLFTSLPGPLQSIVAGVVALGAGLVVVAPAIPAIVGGFQALVGLKIGATIAGYLPVIAQLVGSLGGLLKIIAAVFTGPAGWAALLVAAGVAIYNFRDEIGNVLGDIGSFFADTWNQTGEVVIDFAKDAFKGIRDIFIKPVTDLGKRLFNSFVDIFKSIGRFISLPFIAAFNSIKGIVNSMLRVIASAINSVVNSINKVIGKANRALATLKLPKIPYLPRVGVPRFAEGGVTNGPTLAMVGEGGEREYIVPESKMARASANYLGGMRGKSVIPAFANGGVVGPGAGSRGMSGGAANTTVNVTTGPVLQQDGQNYVTVGDLERALKSFGSQVFRNSRSVGGRRYQGVYS